MCGLRIGECIALKKSDVLPQGLQVDDFGFKGKPAPTKKRKRRLIALSSVLRAELANWAAQVRGGLVVTWPERRIAEPEGRGSYADAVQGTQGTDSESCVSPSSDHVLDPLPGDPRDLQEALGHTDLKLTMHIIGSRFWSASRPLWAN